jgi:hypothetical protein
MTKTAVSKEDVWIEMKNVFLKRASIKKAKLNPAMNLENILDENIFKMGHIMLDLHEVFKLNPEYEPLSEFDHFKVVGDIEKYIVERLA